MPHKRYHIALLIESSRDYGRSLLHGIANYARTYGPWVLYHHERLLGDTAPARIKEWGGDGVIARIESRRLITEISELGLPTVDLLGLHRIEGVPVVRPDDRNTVSLAIDHLLERGFKDFAYCGFAGVYYSDLRGKHFVEELKRRGHDPAIYVGPKVRRGTHIATIEINSLMRGEELAAWIHGLTKPVGIVTCNDLRAQQVLNACAISRVAVPDEVAVVGVDNDEMVCELCNPPLSSVHLNARGIGYEAAAVLHKMLRGEPPPQERVHVPAVGVVTRETTEVQAIPDPATAAAVEFIRQNACNGIKIEDLLRRVPMSYSTLVRRFNQYLHRSPKAEIVRVQLRRVCELLTTTNLPQTEIAELAGFHHMENMYKLFREKTGQTPGEYRRRLQG